MSMASTDEEVELRDLVAECECLADLSQRWDATRRASDRFKLGEDVGPRPDRKPHRAHVSEVPQQLGATAPRPEAPREEAETKAGNGMSAERGAEGLGTKCGEMSDIGNKLAQLQLGRKGSRLRPMS